MSDLLQIGRSALLTYQRQLATASHNVANAATPGYSRQRVDLAAVIGPTTGAGTTGSGVTATGIRRMSDNFLQTRLLADTESLSRQNVFSEAATRIDALLSKSETGISGPLTAFFNAINDVAADPTSISARSVLLSRAEGLSQRFATIGQELQRTASELDSRLRSNVNEVNDLAKRLADLNEQIGLTRGDDSGFPPNDLLDQRDQLLSEMADRIGIRSVRQEDGAINVFTHNGEALVVGSAYNTLSLSREPFGTGRYQLGLQVGATTIPLAGASGGKIGGILDARRELVDNTQAELGRMVTALSLQLNAQHRAGMTLNGAAGGNLFSVPAPVSSAHRDNAGSGSIAGTILDPSALPNGDLILEFDGTNWAARDAATGQSVSMTGSGTAGDPFLVAGMSLTASGLSAAGDRQLVRPTISALSNFQVQISDPRDFAAASPLVASIDSSSSAGLAVGAMSFTAGTAFPAQRIDFLSATTYQVDGGAVQTISGNTVIGPGWSLQLNGTPAAGDGIDLSPPGPNSVDNGNARALFGLQTQAALDGLSVPAFNGELITRVGTTAQQAQLSSESLTSIRDSDLALRDSVSGVNLDEEAAQLLKFQQAYQAAAQVVRTADELFQTLIAAVSR